LDVSEGDIDSSILVVKHVTVADAVWETNQCRLFHISSIHWRVPR